MEPDRSEGSRRTKIPPKETEAAQLLEKIMTWRPRKIYDRYGNRDILLVMETIVTD